MLREENYLKTFALVNANISDVSMLDLGSFVAESTTLTDLDISWNLVKTKSYINLITALGDNRVLKSLNLSFNSIVEEGEKITENKELPWYDQEVEFTDLTTQLI